MISLIDTVVLTRPVINPKETPAATGNVVADEESEGGSNFWKYFFLVFFVIVVAALSAYYLTFNKTMMVDDGISKEFENKKISNLLQSAHEAADNIQVEKAKNLYLQAYKLYLALGDEKKHRVYSSLNNLHNKLMLLNNLGKAHDALDEKNKIKFQQSIVAINALKNDVVHGTALKNYLESSFNYFEDRRLDA